TPPGTHQPTPHPEKPAQTALTPSETDKNKKYIGTLLSSQTSSALKKFHPTGIPLLEAVEHSL
ncbi:hypothetical protein, partial [Corynebacterium phoceense]|uniref:hypothetical protein n=1 Tax=Corynebacterium phoceense TaxID=1686286 RepID=UPI001E4FA927